MKAISSDPKVGYVNILIVEGEGDNIRFIASITKREDTAVVSFYEEYKVSLINIFDPDLFEKFITRMKKEIEPPDHYKKLLPGWKDIFAMWSTHLTIEEEMEILSRAVFLWRMYLHYQKEKNRLYIRHPRMFKVERVNESSNVLSILTRLIDFSSDGVYYIKNNPTEMDMRVYRVSEVLDSRFEEIIVSEKIIEYIELYGREKTVETLELLALSKICLEEMSTKIDDTEPVEYRCCHCGTYNKAGLTRKDGIVVILCSKCNSEYKTKVKAVHNFRKFSSIQGSAANRSPSFYTSPEKVVKEKLEEMGLVEGLSFFHNTRIEGSDRGNYFWLDFIIPSLSLVIEMDPSIWHKIGNREESDKEKYDFLNTLGLKVISLNEKELSNIREKILNGI